MYFKYVITTVVTVVSIWVNVVCVPQIGQARALYNFGNVYHAKGKSICWSGAEPGEFPEEARIALRKAAQYYE